MTQDQHDQSKKNLVSAWVAHSDYAVEAFIFIGEALQHAICCLNCEGTKRHVSAADLLYACIDLAIDRYGLLAVPLFAKWGLFRDEDIGRVTFELIEQGVFGKREEDSIDDFATGCMLRDALRERLRQRLEA